MKRNNRCSTSAQSQLSHDKRPNHCRPSETERGTKTRTEQEPNTEILIDSDDDMDPCHVPPNHPAPKKVKERKGEPFSVEMYEGLDDIATAELYNWLGDQQPATRQFFASKTLHKFKKLLEDTQCRATEMDEYKTALRNYKGKGKSTVVQDKPKYNPDISLVLGPYRSNCWNNSCRGQITKLFPSNAEAVGLDYRLFRTMVIIVLDCRSVWNLRSPRLF
jgi:hypothetical protein